MDESCVVFADWLAAAPPAFQIHISLSFGSEPSNFLIKLDNIMTEHTEHIIEAFLPVDCGH